ncbi:hypothetical protein [Roseobacter cerasinus]|nr:hypothetical protein [Roseobacter cerasinus]
MIGATFLAAFGTTVLAADQVPINVVINQSPWLAGFAAVADLYEE